MDRPNAAQCNPCASLGVTWGNLIRCVQLLLIGVIPAIVDPLMRMILSLATGFLLPVILGSSQLHEQARVGTRAHNFQVTNCHWQWQTDRAWSVSRQWPLSEMERNRRKVSISVGTVSSIESNQASRLSACAYPPLPLTVISLLPASFICPVVDFECFVGQWSAVQSLDMPSRPTW